MPKTYPSDAVVEKNIIGAALIDARSASNILGELSVDDFYADNYKNQKIFQAMLTLYDNNLTIDPATVYNQLVVQKDAEVVGGFEYLEEILDNVISLVNLEYYIKQLRDITLLRNFLKTIDKILNEYQTKEIKNINDFIGDAERMVNEVTSRRRVSTFVSASSAALIYGNKINKTKGTADSISGLRTGFTTLDSKLNGLGKGELVYLAARPSVGKSAFALNIAYNAAAASGTPVAIFSLEMSAEMIFRRLFSMRANIEYEKIQKGFLTKNERTKIEETANDLSKIDLYIDESSGATIDDIVLKSRKLKEQKGGLGLIVVDYIGLIDDEKNIFKDNEQAKIASYSRRLKKLAGELDCPVLCLSQLNRQTEQRENKRPQLSDLRSSGAIEQDADKVLFMYREGYYRDQGISVSGKRKSSNNDENNQQDQNEQSTSDIVKILIAKNRNGQTGQVDLMFLKTCGRFAVIDQSHQDRLDAANRNAFNDIDD